MDLQQSASTVNQNNGNENTQHRDGNAEHSYINTNMYESLDDRTRDSNTYMTSGATTAATGSGARNKDRDVQDGVKAMAAADSSGYISPVHRASEPHTYSDYSIAETAVRKESEPHTYSDYSVAGTAVRKESEPHTYSEYSVAGTAVRKESEPHTYSDYSIAGTPVAKHSDAHTYATATTAFIAADTGSGNLYDSAATGASSKIGLSNITIAAAVVGIILLVTLICTISGVIVYHTVSAKTDASGQTFDGDKDTLGTQWVNISDANDRRFEKLESAIQTILEKLNTTEHVLHTVQENQKLLGTRCESETVNTNGGASIACYKGPKGAGGLPGLDGRPGLPGQDGAKGQSGEQGAMGQPGPMGPPGEAGVKGEQGDRGFMGNTGRKGVRGMDGVSGPAGVPGLPGHDGRKGEKGEPGPQGAPGARK